MSEQRTDTLTQSDHQTRRVLSQYSFVSISFYSFILAFLPLYFQDKGFNASELSLLSAISTLTTVIAPILTLELVHRRLSARRAAQVFMLLSPLTYVAFFLPQTAHAAWALPIFFLVTLCKRGLDTLLETETIRRAALGSLRFEHVRVWGSIGFVCASFLVGGLSDLMGTAAIIYLGLPFLFALVFATMRSQSLLEALPAKQGSLKHVDQSGRFFNRAMVLTVIATSIAWASHGPFYVYFSVYLDELQWSKSAISLAWSIGVFAEILFFVYFPAIESRFGALQVFRLSLLATVLRWLLLANSQTALCIFLSQLLHAFSFSGIYLASIRLISHFAAAHAKERSQGVLLSLGQGAGSLFGRLIAGYFAARLSTYLELPILFHWAALAAIAAVVVAAFIPGLRQRETR